jgi:hypothetical protein
VTGTAILDWSHPTPEHIVSRYVLAGHGSGRRCAGISVIPPHVSASRVVVGGRTQYEGRKFGEAVANVIIFF